LDSSISKPITPRCNLLETAEYDEYARWCERGKPRGIPLLDWKSASSAARFLAAAGFEAVEYAQQLGHLPASPAGLSSGSRFTAKIIGMAGTSPAMTLHVWFDLTETGVFRLELTGWVSLPGLTGQSNIPAGGY
jgi:hypothetical protein